MSESIGSPVHPAGQRQETQSTDGGNLTGEGAIPAPTLYKAPAFMGRSGTPDNQDTSRPKGST